MRENINFDKVGKISDSEVSYPLFLFAKMSACDIQRKMSKIYLLRGNFDQVEEMIGK